MNKKSIAAIVAAVSVIAACNKDYNNKGTTVIDTGTIYPNYKSALADQAVKSKIVTINATTGGSFMGNSGARYVFPPNAFRNSAGALVTGDVQVEAKEFTNKADMLFSGVLPVTATDGLISGGETDVKATQGGQALSLQPGITFQVNLPQHGTPNPNMMVFSGHTDPATGVVNWALNADTSAASITYNGDTLVLNCDSLDLCNADCFMASPDYQTFTLHASCSDGTQVPTVADANNVISAFALYDDFNGVWPMLDVTGSNVAEHHVPNIPVHFAVIGLVKGKFYGGIIGATPATGSTYNVVLKPTTPAAFKAL